MGMNFHQQSIAMFSTELVTTCLNYSNIHIRYMSELNTWGINPSGAYQEQDQLLPFHVNDTRKLKFNLVKQLKVQR